MQFTSIWVVYNFTRLALKYDLPTMIGEDPDFLPNLPPWEIYEAPPEQISVAPPVYLDVDSKGNIYRQKIVRDDLGNYEISEELVTESQLMEISSEQTIILEDREAKRQSIESFNLDLVAASSFTCPLPSSFSITGDSSGQAMGSISVSNTSRPAGATTQWLVFDFFTYNYRDRGSHMPMALFHDDVLHGWGSFIGDNHASTYGCGSSARFNSQIEGWLQITPPAGPLWQSYVFNGSNSCGNEMYDGPVIIVMPYYYVARYRMEMQASTGHWVAYRIWEWKLSSNDWEILTDWRSLDVDAGDWDHLPLQWLTNSEGIFIGATDADSSGTWSVYFSNTQCGWF